MGVSTYIKLSQYIFCKLLSEKTVKSYKPKLYLNKLLKIKSKWSE